MDTKCLMRIWLGDRVGDEVSNRRGSHAETGHHHRYWASNESRTMATRVQFPNGSVIVCGPR